MKQLKRSLHKRTRISKQLSSRKHQEDHFSNFKDDLLTLATPREEDFVTIVAGYGSKNSAYCPGFALTCSVTKRIKESL